MSLIDDSLTVMLIYILLTVGIINYDALLQCRVYLNAQFNRKEAFVNCCWT